MTDMDPTVPPSPETVAYQLEEIRLKRARNIVAAFCEAQHIEPSLEAMNDEQVEYVSSFLTECGLVEDSLDLIEIFVGFEDGEPGGEPAGDREPRTPLPGSDTGALAVPIPMFTEL